MGRGMIDFREKASGKHTVHPVMQDEDEHAQPHEGHERSEIAKQGHDLFVGLVVHTATHEGVHTRHWLHPCLLELDLAGFRVGVFVFHPAAACFGAFYHFTNLIHAVRIMNIPTVLPAISGLAPRARQVPSYL